MRIGLDFGTTNSGAALFDGARVHAFPLDPLSRDPKVMRSTLYITRDQEVTVGQEAIDTYYQQNTGRPSKLVRQYVGEIETTLGEVGSVKGYPVGPQTYVRDVYVLVDELMPGRLLGSLKSALAGRYEGTTVFGRYYALEELVAIYLREVRQRVEVETGQRMDGVVLGRPVHFAGSDGEGGDQRAEERLRQAAQMAGFREVAFELEPVAAALHYELTAQEPQDVVVFDFGGGTLDITVMRLGQSGRQVYATGGLAIAGDAFDRRIVEGVMLDHFGRGSTWGPDAAPFPGQYTDALLDWQSIPELNRPQVLRFLRSAHASSSHPKQIKALISLLVHNDAMRLVDQVEGAKTALSSARFATIQLSGDEIDIWQPITRAQFEALIAEARQRIEDCVRDTVNRSGLGVEAIDAVVRTGGSSQIPCFVEMLERTFGSHRVVLSDVFSGVTAGLAIRAHLGGI